MCYALLVSNDQYWYVIILASSMLEPVSVAAATSPSLFVVSVTIDSVVEDPPQLRFWEAEKNCPSICIQTRVVPFRREKLATIACVAASSWTKNLDGASTTSNGLPLVESRWNSFLIIIHWEGRSNAINSKFDWLSHNDLKQKQKNFI